MPRIVTRALALVVIGLAVAACGDDSSDGGDSAPTSEEAFCESGEQLETDVAALTDIDVVAEGTDAVEDAFSAIRADTDALVASGQDFAADDINALEQAVDELGSALDDLSGELTAANSADVLTAVSDIGTAATSLQTTLTETCG
jgi:hypothetical protein